VAPFGRGINCLATLSDLGCRKPADLRVLADDVLVFGEINAKRLVVRDVAFEPLNVRPKLAEYPIRFCCCSAKLLALEGADLWNVAFDDELCAVPYRSSLIRMLTSALAHGNSLDHLVGTGEQGGYCSNRKRARPARVLNSLASSVPSLSGSAALKRCSTTARYSSLVSVPSLSGSAAANSLALNLPRSSRLSRVSS